MNAAGWFQDELENLRNDPDFLTDELLLDITEQIYVRMEQLKMRPADLARALGVSRPAVSQLLNGKPNMTMRTLVGVATALDQRVRINLAPCASPVTRKSRVRTVPILGAIAAGVPIPLPTAETFTEVQAAETIDVTEDITGCQEDVYALRVQGTSMIDALINDGDIVLLHATNEARDGDLVAVWIKSQNETTLKQFYHGGERVRLQPINQTLSPIYVNTADVEIQGRVVATIRPRQA